jgi:solute carrier family 35 protein E1
MYNISNKRTLNLLPHPFSVSVIQLLVGAAIYLVSIPLNLNSKPILPPSGTMARKYLKHASISHLIGQIFTVLSLSAGAVSFTHIIKSTEPIFSCLASIAYTGQILPTPVYLSLIPIIGGVGFACVNDLSFSLPSLLYAALSNIFFGVRAVSSKLVLDHDKKDAAWSLGGAGGAFGAVTLIAAIIGIPVMLATDLVPFLDALTSHPDSMNVLHLLLISGFYHYINNEVMYRCLSTVTPITLAVGNAFKRVFLIVSSVVVFNTKVSTNGWLGSAIACAGVGGYGIVKEKYDRIEKLKTKKVAATAGKGRGWR